MRFGEEILFDEIQADRPSSWSRTDPIAVVGGAMGVIVLCALLLALPVIAAARGLSDDEEEGTMEPFEYVEARLLKWGEIKDKEALPDRIVPALPTAPEEVLALDRNENKPEPDPKKKVKKPKRQAGAVTDDKLRQVFDKARAFAEIQDDYIPEGHPDGVPDGDVTDPALASMGATYGRRITRLIQERLIVPTLISEGQKRKLKAKILLKFDIDMTIASFKFLKKSGNAMFDDAIQNAVDRVRLEVRNLPTPPEAIAPKVFGGGIAIKIHGKDSEYE
ncbi:MAG: TonB C-terminal domain-containing protein [Deltaproteobacteria bacterium]|nr:TonB C-terminal domain-containing protein [Deltaproteobacteria bacterium]